MPQGELANRGKSLRRQNLRSHDRLQQTAEPTERNAAARDGTFFEQLRKETRQRHLSIEQG